MCPAYYLLISFSAHVESVRAISGMCVSVSRYGGVSTGMSMQPGPSTTAIATIRILEGYEEKQEEQIGSLLLARARAYLYPRLYGMSELER